LALLIMLVLSGCSASTGPEADVRSVLNDPESAKFEAVRERDIGDGPVACGRVNAKNAMGGYPGFRAFMIKDGKLWLATTADEDFAVIQCCGLETTTSRTEDERQALFAQCR